MMKIFSLLCVTIVVTALLPAQQLLEREVDPIPPQVESMFEKGLRFLSNSQTEEGSWPDRYGSEPGVVALCTLAFLAHGEDPNFGPFSQNITRGIDFILNNQSSSNGYIGDSMYNHGFATLALAEAYGVVDNPRLGNALSQAVDLILSSQERNKQSAWRYTPESQDADTTVSGCQIIALLAARNAGIAVPDDAIKAGLSYLNRCRTPSGGYGYTSPSGDKPTLTAIAVTCFAIAKEKDTKGFELSLGYLQDNLSYRDRYYPYYFEYYMSQALFHADIATWEEWNALNIRYLSASQNRDGSWNDSKGSPFATSGALLSLALNYRLLPIYEK